MDSRTTTTTDRRRSGGPLELFVQTAPGLEPALASELGELGVGPFDVEAGGISLAGGLDLVARLNLHLACASSVLVTVGTFRASALGEFERKAAALDWSPFLRPGTGVEFRVTTRKSRLYHTGAIVERLEKAVGGVVGGAPSHGPRGPAEPIQRFVVRGVRDRWIVRVDASGEHLHRRGYRLQTGRAPLRESTAAGVLRLSGWDPDTPLVDPLCGSGTFVIEAALRASRLPPGAKRAFAFESWPGFDAGGWTRLRRSSAEAVRAAAELLLGSDRDAGAVAAATANAERAGVSSAVHFRRQAISQLEAPETTSPGALVCNPPWGRRVSASRDLRDLHARLGQVARREFSGWRLVVVSPDRTLVTRVDRRMQSIARIPVGGVSVGIWMVEQL